MTFAMAKQLHNCVKKWNFKQQLLQVLTMTVIKFFDIAEVQKQRLFESAIDFYYGLTLKTILLWKSDLDHSYLWTTKFHHVTMPAIAPIGNVLLDVVIQYLRNAVL